MPPKMHCALLNIRVDPLNICTSTEFISRDDHIISRNGKGRACRCTYSIYEFPMTLITNITFSQHFVMFSFWTEIQLAQTQMIPSADSEALGNSCWMKISYSFHIDTHFVLPNPQSNCLLPVKTWHEERKTWLHHIRRLNFHRFLSNQEF